MTTGVVGTFENLDFGRWVAECSDQLVPPVANKFLFSGEDQVVMVVGGPNARNDYHINSTSEFFYQLKGSMNLKLVRDNKFEDHWINEGEMFLCPGYTPHNPCRTADTLGLVVELKKRAPDTPDSVRWYCKSGKHAEPTILRHVDFIVTDLFTQLRAEVLKWQQNEDLRKCKECGWVAPPQ